MRAAVHEATRRAGSWSLLALALVAICLVRFDRQDLLIGRWTGAGVWDDVHYEQMVRHFRGEPATVETPWSYRPAVPWLAAQLPWRPGVAINLLNIVACLVTLATLAAMLRRAGFRAGERWVGGALFVASFPLLYYSTIGYVDPWLIALLTLGTCWVLADRFLELLVLIALGVFVKETVALLIPVWVVRRLAVRVGLRCLAFETISLVAVYLIGTLAARGVMAGDVAYLWLPSAAKFQFNLSRLRTYSSLGLSFGLPGVGALVYLVSRGKWLPRHVALPLLTGWAGSLALTGWAFLSANVDGKFVWTCYPFCIPLALAAMRGRIMPAQAKGR